MINRDYNKELKAIGNRVVLRKLVKNNSNQMINGIVVPEKYTEGNWGMAKCIIEDISKQSMKVTNLKKGDLVLMDAASVFYDHHPVVVTNDFNIIAKLTKQD